MSWKDLPSELVQLVANDLGFTDCRRLDMACKTYFTSCLHWSCISCLRDVVPDDEVDSLCRMFESNAPTALRSIELELFPESIPSYAEMSDKIVTAIAKSGVGTRLESLGIFDRVLSGLERVAVSDFATMSLVATFTQLRSLDFSYVNSSKNEDAKTCDQFTALTNLTSLKMHLKGRTNLDVSSVSRLTKLQILHIRPPNRQSRAFVREPFAFPSSLSSLEYQHPLSVTYRDLPSQLTHLDVYVMEEGFRIPESLPLQSLAIRYFFNRFRLDQMCPSLPTSLKAFWCSAVQPVEPHAVLPVVSLLHGSGASLRFLALYFHFKDSIDFSFLTCMTRLNVLSFKFHNRNGDAFSDVLWKYIAASREHLRVVQLSETDECEVSDDVIEYIEQSAHHLEYISLSVHSPPSCYQRRWRNWNGVSLPLEFIVDLARLCRELDLPPVCESWMSDFDSYCLLPKRTPEPDPGIAIRVYGVSDDSVRALKLDTAKLSLNPSLLGKLSATPLHLECRPTLSVLNNFDLMCSQMPAALFFEVENTAYLSASVHVYGSGWRCPTQKEYVYVYIRPRRTFRQLLLFRDRGEPNWLQISYRRSPTPSFMRIHSADRKVDKSSEELYIIDSEDPLLQSNPNTLERFIRMEPTLPNS